MWWEGRRGEGERGKEREEEGTKGEEEGRARDKRVEGKGRREKAGVALSEKLLS